MGYFSFHVLGWRYIYIVKSNNWCLLTSFLCWGDMNDNMGQQTWCSPVLVLKYSVHLTGRVALSNTNPFAGNWHSKVPRTFSRSPRSLIWWRHQMETFSALLALWAGNSPVTGEFPSQRPVTHSFDVFFDLRLNKRLGKQSWGWWFETPLRSLWRHCNAMPAGGLAPVAAWPAGTLSSGPPIVCDQERSTVGLHVCTCAR